MARKQWRDKKKEMSEWANTNIQRKKSFHVKKKKTGRKRKHKGIFRPFKKKSGNKWETGFFFFKKKNNFYMTFSCWKKESVEREKQKKKSKRWESWKKKRKKEKQRKNSYWRKRTKKVSVQKHVRLKKETSFFLKKKEKGKHAKTCIFLFK